MQFIEVTIERNSTVMEYIRNFINYPRSSRIRYYPTDKFTIISETGKKELICPQVEYQYKAANGYCGNKNEISVVGLHKSYKKNIGFQRNKFAGMKESTRMMRKTHNRYKKDNDPLFSREVFADNSQNIVSSIYNATFVTYLTNRKINESDEDFTRDYFQVLHIGCLEETYRMGRYCFAYDPIVVDETDLHYLIHWYFTQWLN